MQGSGAGRNKGVRKGGRCFGWHLSQHPQDFLLWLKYQYSSVRNGRFSAPTRLGGQGRNSLGSNRGQSQSRMSQTCGRSAPWMTPCLPFKKQTGTAERNFPVSFADFLMKPVWVGFYSVKVTLVRWGQRSGIGSERFRGCVLAPTVPSLTHSLITALEEMWQVSKHITTNDGATRVINIRTNTLNVVIYKYRGTGSHNTLWTE